MSRRRAVGGLVAVTLGVTLIGVSLSFRGDPAAEARARLGPLPSRDVPLRAPPRGGPWGPEAAVVGGASPLPDVGGAVDPWVDEDALLKLILASAAVGGPDALSPERLADAIVVAEADSPGHPLLPAAKAWLDLVLAGVAPADAADPWTRWAQLRAAREGRGGDVRAAVEGLLEVWPGHPEACAVGVQHGLQVGDLALAERAGLACGWAGPGVDRLRGDVLDALGRTAEARSAWLDAGADLHVLAVDCQGGVAPDPELVARASALPVSPATLHLGWCAALGFGDLAAADQRAAADPEQGPPWRLVRAALALARGQPERAEAVLGDLDDVAADLLRGRARAAQGDTEGARAAFTAGADRAPLDLHLLRAWVQALPGDLPEVRARLEGIDPVAAVVSAPDGRRERPPYAISPLGPPISDPRVDAALRGAAADPATAADPWRRARLGPGCGGAGAAPGDPLTLQAWCASRPDPGLRAALGPQPDAPGARLARAWLGALEGAPGVDAELEALQRDWPGRVGVARLRVWLAQGGAGGAAGAPLRLDTPSTPP